MTLQVMALNADQPDLIKDFQEAASQKPVEDLPLRPRPPKHPPPAHLKAKTSSGNPELGGLRTPEPRKFRSHRRHLRMLPKAKKRPWKDAEEDDEIGDDFIEKVDECEMVPDATG